MFVYVYFFVSVIVPGVYDSDYFSCSGFRGLPFTCCDSLHKQRALSLFDFYNLQDTI